MLRVAQEGSLWEVEAQEEKRRIEKKVKKRRLQVAVETTVPMGWREQALVGIQYERKEKDDHWIAKALALEFFARGSCCLPYLRCVCLRCVCLRCVCLASVFDASVFDASVFDASVFKASIFDASVFKALVFKALVFGARLSSMTSGLSVFLQGACLRDACCLSVSLRGACLRDACCLFGFLRGAYLRDVDLRAV